MTENEFRQSFRDTPVPPLLLSLLDFQNKLGDWYSGRFELTSGGPETAVAFLDGDEKAAGDFVLFAGSSDGSSYGFWTYGGRNLHNAPIAFLGSEGTGLTVLADSVDGFLSLLAVGEDEMGFAAPFLTEPPSPSAGLLAFRHWLQDEHDISPATYPAVNISLAVRKHPDLQAWLRAWAKSHFGSDAATTTHPAARRQDVPLSDDLKLLLGSPLEIVMKGRFSDSLAANPTVKRQVGIEFSSKHHCLITSIFLHSEGDDGFREYAGELPGGLAFADPRIAVESKLGKADKSGGGTFSPLFKKKMPAWDRHDFSSFSVHIEYGNGENSIRRVTLMTPDTVP